MNIFFGYNGYTVSITENLYNIFIEKSNEVCTSIDCEFIAPRFWIIGVLIYIIAAVLHLKNKITLFDDKSDAFLTIFSPLNHGTPGGCS